MGGNIRKMVGDMEVYMVMDKKVDAVMDVVGDMVGNIWKKVGDIVIYKVMDMLVDTVMDVVGDMVRNLEGDMVGT